MTAVSGICCSAGVTPSDRDASADGADDQRDEDDGGSDAAHTGLIHINELCPDDDGFQVDEEGQTDDWIELYNAGPSRAGAARLHPGRGRPRTPPARAGAGARRRRSCSGPTARPSRAPRHLAFKLAAGGRPGRAARRPTAPLADEVDLPRARHQRGLRPLPRRRARPCAPAATPPRAGPTARAAARRPPPSLPEEARFARFTWPRRWGRAARAAGDHRGRRCGPRGFVEVVNARRRAAAAGRLRPAPGRAWRPGSAWPGPGDGVELPWPRGATLAAGERAGGAGERGRDAGGAGGAPAVEGVLTLFRRSRARWCTGSTSCACPRARPWRWPPRRRRRPGRATGCAATPRPGARQRPLRPAAGPRAVGDRLRQPAHPRRLRARWPRAAPSSTARR